MEPASKSITTTSDTSAGAALYSSFVRRFIYDRLVLGLYCPYAWGCTFAELAAFFNGRVATAISLSSPKTCRLLDIGVGTGCFLEQAPLDDVKEVALLDLNAKCLSAAASRTRKAHPRTECSTFHADILEPISAEKLGGRFDAISMMLLLHCLPGPPSRKGTMLRRLRDLLNKDGVLLGSTVLGKDVTHNVFGKILLWHINRIGGFDNYEDDVASFIKPLEDAFESVNWRIVGRTLLFEARKPKL
ncbi:S-adenosyl-L-methionine-dependent methyltransferase [Phyllosticta citribraziliensis]|uniref:S-adenosyl-L-methionine-dependent methyltransferase n=1 Tax=Phyllosticta citribraziliensis TaxID=989973 RepID=A0ABR1L7G1_9PEZI